MSGLSQCLAVLLLLFTFGFTIFGTEWGKANFVDQWRCPTVDEATNLLHEALKERGDLELKQVYPYVTHWSWKGGNKLPEGTGRYALSFVVRNTSDGKWSNAELLIPPKRFKNLKPEISITYTEHGHNSQLTNEKKSNDDSSRSSYQQPNQALMPTAGLTGTGVSIGVSSGIQGVGISSSGAIMGTP